MLKALELVGFKSFADRTRFEFPSGITAVVGPNGSGKSNVVDAIKWVLGEQSVKSLRGKEMADVIFNGSDSRPPMNTAESTVTFDNSNGFLPIDTPEVHITRRVYRSGEGEYLINRQPSRLRDIRDLFAGTGVTTEAYSVIEQGKVDVLLQTSARDRRAIFEEAAGISRFKAKKVESLRRLERVEQNLLRLADIVDEVDSRLRSVRKQAAKARRYKQYTDRLQELRTQVGLADWRKLGEELEALGAEQTARRDEVAAAEAEAEALEAEALQIETAIAESDEALRATEALAAENRARIASRESTIEQERRRSRDLEEEIARHRQQLSAMNLKAGDLDQQLQATMSAVRAAEDEYQRIGRQADEEQQELKELSSQLEALRRESDRRRSTYMEQMRSASSLSSEISALESQLAAIEATLERSRQQLTEIDDELAALDKELADQRREEREIAERRTHQAEQVDQARQRLADCRQRHADELTRRGQLQQRLSGASERSSVLAELERRLEGVSVAAKELLLASRDATTGPLRQIRGLVADLLQVKVDMAPLVELALGEMAQFLVVSPGRELLDHLQQHAYELADRVGLVRLDYVPVTSLIDEIDLTGQPGVLGRASQFVETAREFAPLIERLLGRTWFVESLPYGLALSESIGRGLQFVTLAGEKVTPDGTLVVGPRQSAAGILSRRSELRALDEQIAELKAQIARSETTLTELESHIEDDERRLDELSGQLQATTDRLAVKHSEVQALEGRRAQAAQHRAQIEAERQAAASRQEGTEATLDDVRARAEQTQARMAELETQIAEHARRMEELDEERQRRHQANTETMIRLAKSEERLGNLRGQLQRFTLDQQERQRALDDSRQRMSECSDRHGATVRAILDAESEVAELYLAKERLAGETVRHHVERDALRQRRGELARQAQMVRDRVRRLEEQVHAKDLAVSEIRLSRDSLASRLRDDYGIELAELVHEPTPEEQHLREEVEQEIAELRRKINNIGNVNLEALTELEELETRFENLSAQHRDLASAKSSLEQIIGKINTDSRRLFAETLETVRGHFQSLFRKLFGGGHADIVLEEGVDILDSGVEIVARPPGKEPRSISLLSGGEKTLTCVALLLAIFRSRPSPFCVLDEVDAALDEANIERFIGVLKEFLAWTQFIIVTHSKKTMTCASSLYGVTMQESGISKRVSVHFDDVSEDGEIRLDRSAAARAADRDERADDNTQAA